MPTFRCKWQERALHATCAALLATLALLVFTHDLAACGADTDCRLADRTYRIAMPDGADDTAPVGAIVFMHGWRSNPSNVMANKALRAFASSRGLALVAPKSSQEGWDIAGSPSERLQVELPFFDRLLVAIKTRHNIDTNNLVATGFSAGGMMTWNLVCYRGDRFRAFVPVAGTYWAPVPTDCATDGSTVVHVHGTTDPMVPMTGRQIAQWRQGDVMTAYNNYRRESGMADAARATEMKRGELTCRATLKTGSRQVLGLCTHPGGHWYNVSYLRTALDLIAKARN